MSGESPTSDVVVPLDILKMSGVNLDGFKAWAKQLGMTLSDFEAAFADCPGTIENVRREMGLFVPEVFAGELANQFGAAHTPNRYLEAEHPMLTQTRVEAGKPGRSFFAANIPQVE
jgi:hypothetical protein